MSRARYKSVDHIPRLREPLTREDTAIISEQYLENELFTMYEEEVHSDYRTEANDYYRMFRLTHLRVVFLQERDYYRTADGLDVL